MTGTETRHPWDRITRHNRHGSVLESVERWHEGPGSQGGRTYLILYSSDGRIRIDISGAWGSLPRAVLLDSGEARPAAEWEAHLKATGQARVESRWCVVDGMEISRERIDREIPGEPEEFCSSECARDVRDEW